MKQSLMNDALAELLRQRQQLEDNARAMLGLEIRVELRAYDSRTNTPAEQKLHRQLFNAAMAHPDGEYGEYKDSKWAEVNDSENEYERHLTVFVESPPTKKQLKVMKAHLARKGRTS